MKRISRLIAIILSLLLLAACGGTSQGAEAPPAIAAPSSEPATTPPPAVEPPPTVEPTPTDQPAPIPFYQFVLDNAIEKDNFDDTITYGDLYDLAAAPDGYVYTPVRFTGKIIQVIEGVGFTGYRFAIDGDYDQLIYVETYPEYPTDNLTEGDYATLYGVTYEMFSYETILGETVTLPAVLAARFELTELPLPEYPTEPVTIKSRYYGTAEIESFAIVDAETYTGELHLTCEITGTVSGSDRLRFELKCYDKDDFFIGNALILDDVSDGDKFRITANAFAPMDTARVEFKTD